MNICITHYINCILILFLGSGTSNVSNTTRRFFGNSEKIVDIIGLSIELIRRFRVILWTMACGWTISTTNFKMYS